MHDFYDNEELLALARFDLSRDRPDEALWKLKKLIDAAEPSPDAVVVAARLYAQLGLVDRAQGLFKRYLELRPGSMQETFELGMTHFDKNELAPAQARWEAVLNALPTHPPALYYLSLLSAREGRAAEARRTLDILLKSAPADNLYVGRSRELLKSLDESGPGFSVPATESPVQISLSRTYGNEH